MPKRYEWKYHGYNARQTESVLGNEKGMSGRTELTCEFSMLLSTALSNQTANGV